MGSRKVVRRVYQSQWGYVNGDIPPDALVKHGSNIWERYVKLSEELVDEDTPIQKAVRPQGHGLAVPFSLPTGDV